MPSPFPGMDPYLEDPSLWRGFHHSLVREPPLEEEYVVLVNRAGSSNVRTSKIWPVDWLATNLPAAGGRL